MSKPDFPIKNPTGCVDILESTRWSRPKKINEGIKLQINSELSMRTGFVEGLQGYNAHFLFDTQFTNSLYSAR